MIRLAKTLQTTIRSCAGAVSLAGCIAMTPAPAAADTIDVGRQFKCQACHVNRLKELRNGDQPALATLEPLSRGPHGKQDPSSTRKMCLSCHDGYVLDSRFVWSEGHTAHPTGIAAPSVASNQKGKPVLPLNDVGLVYCGTCHLGHKGKGKAESAPTFIRTSRENGELCSNCHAEKTAIAGTPHARVKKTGQAPDFESRGICGRCHVPHGGKGPVMWSREPRPAEGSSVDGLCRNCHARGPEPASHPKHVLAWSQSVREHLTGKSATAMPVFDDHARPVDRGAIGCATCHDPHRQEPDGLAPGVKGNYLRLADTDGFMCADCHRSSALFLYQFFHSEKRKH